MYRHALRDRIDLAPHASFSSHLLALIASISFCIFELISIGLLLLVNMLVMSSVVIQHRGCDILKLSVFGDAGMFGEIDRDTNDERPRSIFAVGPGAHFLILDTFQLDVYYANGIRDDGLWEGQFNMSFAKVY